MTASNMALSAAAPADERRQAEERDTWRFALLSRVLPAGFFLLLLVARALELAAFLRRSRAAQIELGTLFAAATLYRLCAIFFLALVVALFLIRTKPLQRKAGLLPALVAIAGTFIMTAVAFMGDRQAPAPRTLVATCLLICGTCLSLLALWRLGRSFSVLPEARRLVTGGLYSMVRHPIYLGEIVGGAGLTLQAFSWPAFVIYLLFVAIQVQRMAYEEAVLAQTFPQYQSYMAHTARLIPGVY